MDISILDSLRDGGYIIYTRHGESTVGKDQTNFNLQDCSTQANLSDVGRGQSFYYGQLLRALRIPISYPIITSPFCRTIETAQIAFGRASVLIDPFWINIYKLNGSFSASEQEKILGSLNSVLEIKPAYKRNKVIIAHSFPNGLGLGQIPYMGAVIVKPLGKGNGYEIIDRLSLEDLSDLYYNDFTTFQSNRVIIYPLKHTFVHKIFII